MTMESVRSLQERGLLLVEDGNHGEARPLRHEFVSAGVAFVRAADMSSGVVDFSGAEKINEEAATRIRKGRGLPGDVILSHKGTVGRVARVPESAPPFVCSPQTTFYRSLDSEHISENFLYYYLKSPEFQAQLRSRQGETDMAPYVSLTSQRNLMLRLLPIDEQRQIAGVLGALDDLVATDLRIAAACRELHQALVSQALDSSAGQGPLSGTARFVNGKNFTKEASGTGRPVIRTPELRSGPSANTVWNDVDADSDFVARPGDVLFVWSGSLMVDRWIHDEALVNQHIFKVIPNAGVPDWLIFSLIERQMPWFTGLAADKATTMGHITRAHLEAAVPLPTPDEVDKLGEQVEPLWDAELELRREALQLASARDELLPLLMSGRVRVKDVAA